MDDFNIDLESIRARAESGRPESQTLYDDRRDLLQYIDNIREAAGRVVCWACREFDTKNWEDCPDCNDLHRLLEVK